MAEKDFLSISNYELKNDIGEGNFGKVKLGVFKKFSIHSIYLWKKYLKAIVGFSILKIFF